VSKRTAQKYPRQILCARPPGQAWATFLRNHAHETWAGDFLQVTDLLFRSLFACFLVELSSHRVVHVGVTRHRTDAWVAQQLRTATPCNQQPRYRIRDNDASSGQPSPRDCGRRHHDPAHALPRPAGERGVRALLGERAARVPRPRVLAVYSIRSNSLAVQIREGQDLGADGLNGKHRCAGTCSGATPPTPSTRRARPATRSPRSRRSRYDASSQCRAGTGSTRSICWP
jgi:hypothetical protein